MLNFFGPLSQFDLIEFTPTCCFDITSFFIGINEFDLNILVTIIFIFLWQYYELINFTNDENDLDFEIEDNENDITLEKNNGTGTAFLFGTIFSANISGMLPYSQTITAQILFTLLLSIITMLTIWGQAFFNNKIQMLNHFLPNGSPLIITPFIILIELISNISRIISISVRLFANMTSGHALLKILASFGLIALTISSFWAVLAVFPILIIFIITVLELLIAFLQTYVFCTLMLIYISEQE